MVKPVRAMKAKTIMTGLRRCILSATNAAVKDAVEYISFGAGDDGEDEKMYALKKDTA